MAAVSTGSERRIACARLGGGVALLDAVLFVALLAEGHGLVLKLNLTFFQRGHQVTPKVFT
jgi:hypothetical protein